MMAKSSTGSCSPRCAFEVAAERVRRRVVHVRRRRVLRLLRLARPAVCVIMLRSSRYCASPPVTTPTLLLAGGDGPAEIAERRQLQDTEIRDDALGRRAAERLADQLAGVAVVPDALGDRDRLDLLQQRSRSGIVGRAAHGAHHQLVGLRRTGWDRRSFLLEADADDDRACWARESSWSFSLTRPCRPACASRRRPSSLRARPGCRRRGCRPRAPWRGRRPRCSSRRPRAASA